MDNNEHTKRNTESTNGTGGKQASYLQCQREFSWLEIVNSVFKMETNTTPNDRCEDQGVTFKLRNLFCINYQANFEFLHVSFRPRMNEGWEIRSFRASCAHVDLWLGQES